MKVLAAFPLRNVTAYDGCFPKPSRFNLLANIHQKKIYNHVVDSGQRTLVLVSFSDWLVTVQLFCYLIKS